MSVENTHYGAKIISASLAFCKSIFFIGIGGISMSALAELSLQSGFRVGGSDRTPSDLTRALEAHGATLFFGHDASHINDYDAVVYTVAIDPENPEYLAAKAAHKPLFSRADYLGYVMSEFRTRIGIAGMHGKTSCTAITAEILLRAADPTVFCGAKLPALANSPCRIGAAREHFLFEACEYMDSFLDFSPTLAVILNIGLDHVDYFHSMEQIRTSFLRYAEQVGKSGSVLYNADDAECRRTLETFDGKMYTFAVRSPADFTAKNIRTSHGAVTFDFCKRDEVLCTPTLHAVGLHSVYNALAAASAAYLSGIPTQAIAEGIGSFSGAGRRMEYKGKLLSGATVYDDYAHHPDEIRATLSAARELGAKRILCVYQPHTYSRTAGLLDEFADALGNADRVLLADIYAAREENRLGVSSKALAERIGSTACYCGSFDRLATSIAAEASADDLVLVMGAGDIDRIFPLLL